MQDYEFQDQRDKKRVKAGFCLTHVKLINTLLVMRMMQFIELSFDWQVCKLGAKEGYKRLEFLR